MLVLLHNLCTLWKWNRKQAKAENKVQTQRARSSNYTTGKKRENIYPTATKSEAPFLKGAKTGNFKIFMSM